MLSGTVAMLAHEERFLTYITRHERLANNFELEVGRFYDLLLEHRTPLQRLEILEPLRERAAALLSLATEEAEVVNLIAQSNLQRIQDTIIAHE